MRGFEDVMASELTWLVRAGVPARGIRLTVRELVAMRIAETPTGAPMVTGSVEAAVRAACRLVCAMGAPPELVDTVCGAALEAVRGHGGESARWLADATGAVHDVLEEMARERADDPIWRWTARRMPR